MEATHSLGRGDAADARSQVAADADFEAIFLEHFPRVAGILSRLTGDRDQAEELANQVFWRLYRDQRALLLSGNVAGWLYRTATRAGIDALRAGTRRGRYERAAALDRGPDGLAEDSQLQNLVRAEERAGVRSVLSAMKPRQAQIILMRADGASYKELAEALNVAPSGIGTLLNRAEAEFRDRYLKLNGQKEKV